MFFSTLHQHLHILPMFLRNLIEEFRFCELKDTSSLQTQFPIPFIGACRQSVYSASSSPPSFVSFSLSLRKFLLSFFCQQVTSGTKIGVKVMKTIDVIYRVNSIKKPSKKEPKFSSSCFGHSKNDTHKKEENQPP